MAGMNSPLVRYRGATLLLRCCSSGARRCRSSLPQNPFLDRLDLQRQIFRVDPALREAAGDEPEAGLPGARIHVTQLEAVAKAPDRADPVGDGVAEQFLHQIFLCLVTGREHDQVGRKGCAVLHANALGDEALDVGKLPELDRALDDEVGAADVEIIATAPGEIFELPTGARLAEVELEA